MQILAATLLLVVIAPLALTAESAAADPLKGVPAAQWIARLGSDSFKEREEASQVLADAGELVIPELKKAVESSDQEVRLRAQLALTALVTLSIEGTFERVASESYNSAGQRTIQSNETAESELTIEKGRVIFKQDYGKGVEQIYSFPETTSLSFRKMCSIELNWESMSVSVGYNADSQDAKLECENTPEGLCITLSARDTGGTSFKMVYVPAAEAVKIRGARPKEQNVKP